MNNRRLVICLLIAFVVVGSSLIYTWRWNQRAQQTLEEVTEIADLAQKVGDVLAPMAKSRADLKLVLDEFKQMTLELKTPDAKWVKTAKQAVKGAEDKTAALEGVSRNVEQYAKAKGWLARDPIPDLLETARFVGSEHRQDLEIINPVMIAATATAQTKELANRVAKAKADLDQILTSLQDTPVIDPRYKEVIKSLDEANRSAQDVMKDISDFSTSLSKAQPALSPEENKALQELSAPLRAGVDQLQERMDRAMAILGRSRA